MRPVVLGYHPRFNGKARLYLVAKLLVLFGGCFGGPELLPEPDMNPADVANKILAEYDSDADGELSSSELQSCEGLSQLSENKLMPLDADGNGGVSATELTDKFKQFVQARRDSFHCKVFYRGRPLEGGTVTLIPEGFMGGGIPHATGEVDLNGLCDLGTDDGLPGVVAGVYRVEINHPAADIPARYNTESTLGVAIDYTNPYAETVEFKLK